MELNATQKRLVTLLFMQGGTSRATLADSLGVSKPGLTQSVKPLLDEKILLLGEKISTGRAGRNQEPLRLNPEYGYFLGVDIRKHNCYTCLLDFAGSLVEENRFLDLEGLRSYIEGISSTRKLLEVAFTMRGYSDEERFLAGRPDFDVLKKRLERKQIPTHFVNNVEALGNVYHLYHQEERNFLLIKYGPGLGSAIFIGGKSLRKEGSRSSEIGHSYLAGGKTLEETISFEALFHKETEEEEGAELLQLDKEKSEWVFSTLALAVLDADCLLGLDRIVLTGAFLSKKENKDELVSYIRKLYKSFDGNKVTGMDSYDELNRRKGALQAFLDLYLA